MFIFQQPLAQRGFAQSGLYYKPVKINIGETIAERWTTQADADKRGGVT
jgi:hypothetical protein